ncbi:MAG: hypothetical protein AAF204_00960, partial [Pseudomonadota bacterium]
MKTLSKYALKLAEADMVFWLMPPLMLLLIAGTLAQRWMGLWPAMDMFFEGFILWAPIFSIPIPLPGAYTLLGLLVLNLTLKFLLKSEWKWSKSGIILSHLGALILLIGGLITAMNARESYMYIAEGQEARFIYSYSERELMIFEGQEPLTKISFDTLTQQNPEGLPFEINILYTCENCEISKREETQDFDENAAYQSMAQFMALSSKPK